MATCVWLGASQSVPQQNTVTPASVGIGNTFTVTVNGKSVSYTAAAATVADVTAGLVAALSATAEPEFRELTVTDETTLVRITGPQDGTPFVQMSGASGGTATLTTATAVAASGPSWWSVVANWSGGAVPVAGDAVVFDGTATTDCLDGLNQSGVTLASLTVTGAYTGVIGRPARNDGGYAEYRDQFLRVGVSGAVLIGEGEGGGPGLFRLDTGAAATNLTVFAGTVDWKGTHATGNVLARSGGTLTVAGAAGSAAVVAELSVIDAAGGTGAFSATGGTPDVDLGAGATATTVSVDGGSVRAAGTLTDVSVAGGTLKLAGHATASGTVVVLPGATLKLETDGALNDLDVSGTLDCSDDARGRAVATLVVRPGYQVIDPDRTMTIATPVEMIGCGLEGMNLGRQFKATFAELP